tara:strand:- start:345 stop:650 length:306 start_codon:yes stop_codon:yes gene_type:complete
MRDEITYTADGHATSFSGPGAVNVFAMTVLASGLVLYAETGMRPARGYTPAAMMDAARRYLGDAADGIKARDYRGMATVLRAHVRTEKVRIARGADAVLVE